MPTSDINLVPKEVQLQKKKRNYQRAWLIGGVVQFVLVLAVTVALILINLSQNRAITSAQKDIDRDLKIISSQLATLGVVKDIENRTNYVRQVFSTRNYYSKLLSLMPTLLPQGATVQQLSVTGDTLKLVGTALSTVDVAKFLKVAVAPDQGGQYFKSVQLRSVSLNQGSGTVQFLIHLDLIKGVLGKE